MSTATLPPPPVTEAEPPAAPSVTPPEQAAPTETAEVRVVPWTPAAYNAASEAGAFDGMKVQLLKGKVYEMPGMGDRHKIGANKSTRLFHRLFDTDERYVQEAKPERLTDSEPEPDIAVIAGDIERPSNDPNDVLLVVEVSDTTLRLDRTLKLTVYAEAGYREYWILDVNARRLLVHRDPRPAEGRYATQFEVAADGSLAPLFEPEATVNVADMLPHPDAF